MPYIKVENRSGEPLVAQIYKDSTLVGTTDTKGEMEIASGDYVAKVDNYDQKRFRVHNQSTPNYVSMTKISELNAPKGNALTNLKQGDLIVFGGTALILLLLGSGILSAKKKKV